MKQKGIVTIDGNILEGEMNMNFMINFKIVIGVNKQFSNRINRQFDKKNNKYFMEGSVKKNIFTQEEPWDEHRGCSSQTSSGF
jgi:hypothetical protein